ncbi:Transcriptional regulator [Ferriphaselus amnicola]|uniref:Transcriptional regulator n=1 Tax=Ferriphaselus amnicola TaxID=1188319 RepID=A0A2Z6GEV0_9PROT|nr:helix-turn-helix transcriptional regulator [Ferriphaselus amnicola]BBE51990.1 Transcriptional regulator [Ferriphaselus amnicola]
MEPEVAFGQVLKSLRKARGLSQERLALDAGIERNYISLLERGRNSVSVKIIFKIAGALRIQPSVLLGMVEEKMAASSTQLTCESA